MEISLLSVLFQFVFLKLIMTILGFSGGSDGTESACNAEELGLIPGSGRPPRRREWQPTPVFLPGEFNGQRRLAICSPWGPRESDTTEGLSLITTTTTL